VEKKKKPTQKAKKILYVPIPINFLSRKYYKCGLQVHIKKQNKKFEGGITWG